MKKSATCFCEYSNGFGVKSGMLCERNGSHQLVTQCPQDHWCTGISNNSSQVVNAMDLCEKTAVNCGYGQYAPRCSLCKLAHRTEDDSYNSWCGGHCYFDQQDGQCKIKGTEGNEIVWHGLWFFYQYLKKHTSKFVNLNIRWLYKSSTQQLC